MDCCGGRHGYHGDPPLRDDFPQGRVFQDGRGDGGRNGGNFRWGSNLLGKRGVPSQSVRTRGSVGLSRLPRLALRCKGCCDGGGSAGGGGGGGSSGPPCVVVFIGCTRWCIIAQVRVSRALADGGEGIGGKGAVVHGGNGVAAAL